MKTQLTIFLMLCLSFSTKPSLSQSTLNWGTYIGGEFGASITDVAVSNGYVAVVGSTSSAENIAFGDNIHQSYLNNVAGEPLMLRDAYVALYTVEGELQWCTYYGGELDELVSALVFDGESITIVGSTRSSLDIATEGAFQESFGGGFYDGFIAHFNLQGELLWASYFGGDGTDHIYDIDTDSAGNYWVCGVTSSTNLFLLNPFEDTLQGTEDALLSKFNSSGEVVFSSYLGGTDEDGATGISAASDNEVYITGRTNSNDFPGSTSGFLNEYQGGFNDLFISRVQNFNLVSNTYYGGDSSESRPRIDFNSGSINLLANTSSDNLPLNQDSFQPSSSGFGDGVLINFESGLSELNWGTYVGGSQSENLYDINTTEESIFLIGASNSSGQASPNAFQNEVYEEGGFNDFVIFQFNLNGGYQHSTYFGGEGGDFGTSISPISDTQVIFAGNSNSSGLSTNNAHQEQLYSGWMHGYLGLMDFGVGIDEEAEGLSDLKIYPNPSAGQIRLQSKAFSEGERVTISIYNTHGQAVQHSTTAFNTNMGISLEELSSGVYEVLLTNGVSSVRQRLILQ